MNRRTLILTALAGMTAAAPAMSADSLGQYTRDWENKLGIWEEVHTRQYLRDFTDDVIQYAAQVLSTAHKATLEELAKAYLNLVNLNEWVTYLLSTTSPTDPNYPKLQIAKAQVRAAMTAVENNAANRFGVSPGQLLKLANKFGSPNPPPFIYDEK